MRAGAGRSCFARGLRRGAGAFEHFLEKVVPNPEWLSLLNSDDTVARYTLDIFEHSPYFAEELIRNPELMEELERLGAATMSRRGDRLAL